MNVFSSDAVAKFWSLVERTDNCWLWKAGTNNMGYGQYRPTADSRWLAHRFSWLVTYGDIGTFYVLHHCDNPLCVRPEHLFLGTQLDNIRDMHAKGRAAIGVRHGGAKLSLRDVEQIRVLRAKKVPILMLASKYGVAIATISRVANGVLWKRK